MFTFGKRPGYFSPFVQFRTYLLKTGASMNGQFSLVTRKYQTGMFFTAIFLVDNVVLRKPMRGLIKIK